MAVQRSMTTSSPPSWAIRAASQLDDAELEPQDPGAGRHRLSRVRHAQLGPPEDVDHVERPGRRDRLGQRPERGHAQDLVARSG